MIRWLDQKNLMLNAQLADILRNMLARAPYFDLHFSLIKWWKTLFPSAPKPIPIHDFGDETERTNFPHPPQKKKKSLWKLFEMEKVKSNLRGEARESVRAMRRATQIFQRSICYYGASWRANKRLHVLTKENARKFTEPTATHAHMHPHSFLLRDIII